MSRQVCAGPGAPEGQLIQLGPGVAGDDVDRGQLPDDTTGARQAANVEAVDADQLSRPLGLDMPLRFWFGGRLEGCPVAGNQGESLGASVEPVPAQDAPDAVG